MTKPCAILLLVAVCCAAYWQDETRVLRCPRISVINSQGNEAYWAQLQAENPAIFPIRTRTAIKMSVYAETPGYVRVTQASARGDSAILSQPLVKGSNTIRIFCEPATYRLVPSVPARARLFMWRNLRLQPLVPVGGGYPEYLLAKDSSTATYYRVSSDTSAVLRATGPAFAYIYVRAYVPVSKGSTTLEFEMKSRKGTVSHKLIQAVASSEAAFTRPVIGYVPGKAALVKVKVPAGTHEYTVRTINDRSLVTFYYKKVAYHPPRRTVTPVLGAAPRPESPAVALSTGGQDLSLTVRTGFFYNNNVFAYGEDKYEGFPPDSSTEYRYPDVKSLGDVYLPLDLKARYRLGAFQLRGEAGGMMYGANRKLNSVDYALGLGWNGPAIVEFAYTHYPENAVRPSYTGVPGSYAMLAYTCHRADMSMGIRTKWNPGIVFSYGVYDYQPPFDYLNAVFFEGELGIRRNRVFGVIRDRMIGMKASVSLGDVMAVKEASIDRSNGFFSIKTGVDLDVRSWTFGISGGLLPRFYSTESDSDSNRKRRDLEYSLTPLLQYHRGPMTATIHVLDISGRRVWAVDPDDETAKSYATFGGGLRVALNVKPLMWRPAQRS